VSGVSRRAALAGALAALATGCGARAPARDGRAPVRPLKLEPVTSLVAAAGLEWLVAIEPKAFVAAPETAMAVSELFPDDHFDAFAARYGSDLRGFDELVVAGYPGTQLALARGYFDPARIEAAFAARNVVDSRHLDASGLVHVDGRIGQTPERLVLFGARAAGVERGKAGPLRAAGLFATDRLKRARPALDAPPLSDAARLLGGDWRARAFFPGPFADEWAQAGGGLLRVATAAALGARPVAGPEPGGRIELTLVVLGRFDDHEDAGARLGAALDRLLSSDVGRLLGADRPDAPLRVDSIPEQGLRAHVVLRASPLFRGLHVATEGSAEEIVGR
jgi:hypothetical protein